MESFQLGFKLSSEQKIISIWQFPVKKILSQHQVCSRKNNKMLLKTLWWEIRPQKGLKKFYFSKCNLKSLLKGTSMDTSVIVNWNLWLISVLYFLLNIPLYSLIIALWCSSSAQNYLYDSPEAVTTQAVSRRYPKTSFQAKNWNFWKYAHNSGNLRFQGIFCPFLSAVNRKFLTGSHSIYLAGLQGRRQRGTR